MLDLDDFTTLAHGLDDAWLCDHLDITPRTLRRWKAGAKTPKAVLLLLRYINYCDLSAIGGKEWEGFIMGRGCLQVPLFHRPFSAGQIKAMFFTTQDAWATRADLKQAQQEIAALHQRLHQNSF